MNISKEQIDDLNATISIQIGKDDYEPKVNDILRDYRRKASMPGFRPGKVPEGLIRKMYGKAVLLDEINKLLSESLPKYMEEQDLKTLGNPLPKPNDDMEWEIGNDFSFEFEIGFAPEINILLSKDDRINKYQIVVDENLIDKEIETYSSHWGAYMDVDAVEDFKEKLIGDIVQLGEDGQALQDGLSAEDSSLLVGVIKDDECKKLFENAKAGDEIVFNLWNAFPNKWEIASILKKEKDEVSDISGMLFRYTVKTLQRHVNAEMNQDLFDKIAGKDVVTNLEEFKNWIREDFISEYEEICFPKFNTDMRVYLMNKYDPAIPEDFLYRWLKTVSKDLDEEVFDEEFPQFLYNTKWELIANAIIKKYDLKVDEQEIIDAAKDVARNQYSMYGLNNISDEYITHRAMDMLKEEQNVKSMASQALGVKIARKVHEIVDLNIQEISMEDFDKMMYEQKYGQEQLEEMEEPEEDDFIEDVEADELVEDNNAVEEAAAPDDIDSSDETPETVEEVIEIVEEENKEQLIIDN